LSESRLFIKNRVIKSEWYGLMEIMPVEKERKTAYEYTLIAQEVKKGNQVLILRDASGEPVWSGWRKIY